MHYDEPLYRPPSEARSLIVQVTRGCSHNRCTFCAMYQSKRFRAYRRDEVRAAIAQARHEHGAGVRRVFLADGDALVLSSARLLEILAALRESFPALERVSSYFLPSSLATKSDDDLAALRAGGLGLAYLGLESGDDSVLAAIDKGCDAEAMVAATLRLRQAGVAVSVIVLLGLAGAAGSRAHAEATARAVNRMQPEYLSALTVTPIPGTGFHERIAAGTLEPLDARGSLAELAHLLGRLSLSHTVFRTNHASNYLPLAGVLDRDREELLAAIAAALAGRVPLRPEWLRGL